MVVDDALTGDMECLGDDGINEEASYAAASSSKSPHAGSKFWISVSARTGFRRLHVTGQCWYRAAKVEVLADLGAASYHARCGVCWKVAASGADVKAAEAKTSDSDSSVVTDEESSSSEES